MILSILNTQSKAKQERVSLAYGSRVSKEQIEIIRLLDELNYRDIPCENPRSLLLLRNYYRLLDIE